MWLELLDFREPMPYVYLNTTPPFVKVEVDEFHYLRIFDLNCEFVLCN
jgi:hypothetical protein